METEYLVVNCLGNENVVAALEDKTSEQPQWFLHSCVPSGLQTHQHPLSPGKAVAIMTYMVIFERPHHKGGEIGLA